jgi:hypothetical protein
MGVEEGEEIQNKATDNLFNKIIAEKFPNLENKRVTQIQEAYRTPNHQDQKGNTPRHIIIKILNIQNKERLVKASKEKTQVTYKGNPMTVTRFLNTNSKCKKVVERHIPGPERKQLST